MASRVSSSGAWVRTRSSQESLVSSMAAHSSPRGSTPASVNSSSGTRVSTLPNCSRPSALASRLAGSTVSTRTLPPRWAAAMAAVAAAVVVLPTPPDPQVTTISFDAYSCSIVPRGSVRRPLPRARLAGLPGGSPAFDEPRVATSVPDLGGEGVGDGPGRSHAVVAGEQVGDVEQGQVGRELGPQAGEVAGSCAPQRHRELGRVEHRLGGTPGQARQD